MLLTIYFDPPSAIIRSREAIPIPIFNPWPEVNLCWSSSAWSRERIKMNAAAKPANKPAPPPMTYASVFHFDFSVIYHLAP